MAKTDIVDPSRQIFRVGEVAYKRAVSEATFTKVAATNNFIATYQTDIKEWKLNGLYGVATGVSLYDGVASFFYNSEIVGINFYNGKSGASGVTEFDIIWTNQSGVNQGSIFSTKPRILSTASDNVIVFQNLQTGTSVIPAGTVGAAFSKTQFLEGESLYLVLNSAMSEALNCGLTIFYRPIN